MKRGDYAIEFVGLAGLGTLQAERPGRLAKVVTADQPRDGGEVPRDEPRENIDDEERDEKRVGGLAHQDQERGLRQRAIEIGERRFNVQGADLPLRTVDAI